MRTDRSMWKVIFFSFCTCGLYAVWWWATIGEDLNILIPEKPRTMSYWLVTFVLNFLTCGIWSLVWKTQVSNKIGDVCEKYGSEYTLSGGDFWIFDILLSFVLVGPFIYLYRVSRCMNSVCAAYNAKAIQNSSYSSF